MYALGQQVDNGISEVSARCYFTYVLIIGLQETTGRTIEKNNAPFIQKSVT